MALYGQNVQVSGNPKASYVSNLGLFRDNIQDLPDCGSSDSIEKIVLLRVIIRSRGLQG